jgi:hypothetical protein
MVHGVYIFSGGNYVQCGDEKKMKPKNDQATEKKENKNHVVGEANVPIVPGGIWYVKEGKALG